MALSWNEIKKRSIEFSKEWESESREHAEAKSFWDDFFNVFGISRRRVATFEEPVKKLNTHQGFIDLFWKGQLIVEHKSKGKDLVEAIQQAVDYLPNIKEEELPRYILVSDFETFILRDLESGNTHEFKLSELHKNIKLFGFIAGYITKSEIKDEDPVNIKAAELMGKLHDSLKSSGYSGHALEVFLVRILFCLFADDSGIFERGIFFDFLERNTREDGRDIGPQLSLLFQILNTPEDKRYNSLDESLQPFPYIDGKLFEESLPLPAFDSSMRDALTLCAHFDWGKISPAIFGSLFQSVMNQQERRNLGAHYTSEKNILKLIKPLFLDELWEEFNKIKNSKQKLFDFQNKLASLKFLDPACGCGNFLIITYRELRRLELEVIKILYLESGQQMLQSDIASKINVDQMYGIEIEEWPARIAEVAMWLMDHQMNMELSEAAGRYLPRLPLSAAAKIVVGNALRIDWEDVVPKSELSYILGNPPFVGSTLMSPEQREDLRFATNDTDNYGVLDLVAAWYFIAAEYIQGTRIRCAFVSTNSIAQGEQTSILWKPLIVEKGVHIHFAHRTFKWHNEARGKAGVFVVIVGFGNFDIERKSIFEYQNVSEEAHEILAKNINPYLLDSPNVFLANRSTPLEEGTPKIIFGNMPRDGGHLLLNSDEKEDLIEIEPSAEKWVRHYISAKEFLHNEKRWCLWLVNISPRELNSLPKVKERVQAVRDFRMASKAASTRGFAYTPSLFAQLVQPNTDYIFIPRHSSENRRYIPMSIFSKDDIVADSALAVVNAGIFHFGVLNSEMHMTWMRYTAGRLESRYRYSKDIVYNNFPWPQDISDIQKKSIEEKAQAILDTRKRYPNSSLADLYDPLTMPADLLRAHKELDRAVDKAYRSKPFANEMDRMEFLFERYEELVRKSNIK